MVKLGCCEVFYPADPRLYEELGAEVREMEVKKGNVMKLCVPAREWQKVSGKVEDVVVEAEIAQDLVRKVNEVSGGYVFFGRDGSYIHPDGARFFWNAAKKLEKMIREAVMKKVNEQKFRAVSSNTISVEIQLSDINFDEFVSEVEKARRATEEEEERRRYLDRIIEIAKEKNFEVSAHEKYAIVTVKYGVGDSVKYVGGVTIYYSDEGIEKLKSIDARDYYISKLEQELQQMQQKVKSYELLVQKLVRNLREEIEEIAEKREEELSEEELKLSKEEIALIRSLL